MNGSTREKTARKRPSGLRAGPRFVLPPKPARVRPTSAGRVRPCSRGPYIVIASSFHRAVKSSGRVTCSAETSADCTPRCVASLKKSRSPACPHFRSMKPQSASPNRYGKYTSGLPPICSIPGRSPVSSASRIHMAVSGFSWPRERYSAIPSTNQVGRETGAYESGLPVLQRGELERVHQLVAQHVVVIRGNPRERNEDAPAQALGDPALAGGDQTRDCACLLEIGEAVVQDHLLRAPRPNPSRSAWCAYHRSRRCAASMTGGASFG